MLGVSRVGTVPLPFFAVATEMEDILAFLPFGSTSKVSLNCKGTLSLLLLGSGMLA